MNPFRTETDSMAEIQVAPVAKAARQYRVDTLNALFLTPLPGTQLWDQMKLEDRIAPRHR